jgi:hypothetical protein
VYEALFEKARHRSIGKAVRAGRVEYTVIGVMAKRASPAVSGGRR